MFVQTMVFYKLGYAYLVNILLENLLMIYFIMFNYGDQELF